MPDWSAHFYNGFMWPLEQAGLQRLRRRLLQTAQGRVLELGVGTGVNWPLYGLAGSVELLFGLDVGGAKLTGVGARQTAVSPATILQADAQTLPFAPDAFDTVVATLVFCSIPRPEVALAEVARVLRPNGRFLLLEHVRGQGSISRRLTDWLQPVWYALQRECHLNRETALSVAQAGFHIEQISTHGWGVVQMIRSRNAAIPQSPCPK
ncbi:MAG: class I SAM-dependent methyltransferase [Chloroflexota bacterium]